MELSEQIKELIMQRMMSGEKLPTEVQMMDMFHVSRTALREALSAFEANGMLRTSQGSGRYATIPDIGKQIVDSWSMVFFAKPEVLLDFLEIRSLLEINSISRAMQNASIEQYTQMQTEVDEMKECALRGENFSVHDRAFHRILFSGTKNILLEQLMTAFWDVYEKSIVNRSHDRLLESAKQHQEILDAFIRKDFEQLNFCMKKQFEEARYHVILTLIENKTDSK